MITSKAGVDVDCAWTTTAVAENITSTNTAHELFKCDLDISMFLYGMLTQTALREGPFLHGPVISF